MAGLGGDIVTPSDKPGFVTPEIKAPAMVTGDTPYRGSVTDVTKTPALLASTT